MTFSLTWLPEVLANADLKVALVDGWKDRGRGPVGETLGVICHHTVGQPVGNMPSLDALIRGRPDLGGPLSQLGLGRDGTFYVIAAGRANHAGPGSWKGIDAGNTHFIGIEAEHTGKPQDPWPAVQIDAYQRGVAAILKRAQRTVDYCIGHKEWAPGRKPDPTFDMNAFRVQVGAILNGTAAAPVLIPAVEPAPGGAGGRATLRRGATGEQVKELQKLLGLVPDGSFGPRTEAAMRAVQRAFGMVPDGIVGPKTWAALDQASRATVQASVSAVTTPQGATMADELPPLTMTDLSSAIANPNFKSYIYIGNADDRPWNFAKKAQQLLAGLRVYRASPQPFGDQVRTQFGAGPGVVGIVCGFDGKLKRLLNSAEADDFLTLSEAVASA
jgi:hypothetical protein